MIRNYRCCLACQMIRPIPRDFKTRQGEHTARSTRLGYINTIRSKKEAHLNTKKIKPYQPNLSMTPHGSRTKRQATNGHITPKREIDKSQPSKRLLPLPYRSRFMDTKVLIGRAITLAVAVCYRSSILQELYAFTKLFNKIIGRAV